MWNLQLVSPSPVAKFSSDVVPAKSNDLCGNTHRERERERERETIVIKKQCGGMEAARLRKQRP